MKTPPELITDIELESSNKMVDELSRTVLKFESSNSELIQRIEKLEQKLESKIITENESKAKKIKKRTFELLETSTTHGIPNIVRSKSLFVLTMWSIFTITSTCLGSYYAIDTILGYLKYKTITKIEVINERQVPFPAISICAFPSFNSSLDKIISDYIFEDLTLKNLVKNISTYYEEYTDVIMGKCFRLNSGKNIYNESFNIFNSTISGSRYGFRLNMKIPVADRNDFSEIKMFIHNQSFPP